ncbi:MAG: hypothetical protein IJ666_00710 [Ruminococcus sp.]|nr:hypothetical protein [Ruminococcus sp.]
MERILRNSEAPEIIPCDFSSPLLFYPIRHHSPVCSFQLVRTIEEYKPDIVLIEGPENANGLIPVLTDENTTLPAAFYYFYKDTKKLVSDDAKDYKCYYPFVYSSPEYNALVSAKKLNIPAKFIDLPYCEILIATAENNGLRKNSDKHSYADDSYLVQNRFYEKICEKTGLRSFEEFWEKYFETAGIFLTPQQFIKQMHTYCRFTRDDVSQEEMIADGTSARENHMAVRIIEAMQEYRRVLVVTGGFHCIGLYNLVNSGKKIKSPRLHKMPETHHGCFPMAYSYEAADALHGYSSGMSFPYFYDCAMKKLLESNSPEGVYNGITLDFLVRTQKEAVKKDIAVSIADITSAHTLMNGLAALRNAKECGISELFDGVISTFIKGERTVSTSIPLDILSKLATGDKIGAIGDKSHVPPLITDFEKNCKKLNIKYETAVPKNIENALFTSAKGMETSRFLHRMDFLGTGFAKMLKGPDLHKNKDRSRVREEWKYRRTPNVDACLIDHTTDGFTIEEACSSVAARKLMSERRCETAAQISVDCFLMGIPMQQAELAQIEDILINDGDFFSVGRGMHSFEILYSLQNLYGFEDKSSLAHLTRCFDKLVSSLPSMANTPPERGEECITVMKYMYGIVGNILSERLDDFRQALITMSEAPAKEPSVFGAAMGILYSIEPERRDDAENAMKGYLRGSPEIKKQGAEYLKGLFGTARDIVLIDDRFLRMTDELVQSMDYEDFLEILPSLRLSFSCFTPNEIQSTAEIIAGMYNSDGGDITDMPAVDERLFFFGEKLDREIFALMGKEDMLE